MHDVRMLADQLVSLWSWARDMLIDGRTRDRPALARSLADSSAAMIDAAIIRMKGADPESVAERLLSPEQRAELTSGTMALRANILARDDAALIEQAGSAEALVDSVLAGAASAYLPGTCLAPCTVRYRVATLQGEVVRLVAHDAKACHPSNDDPQVVATVTLAMSLRTMLQVFTGQIDANRVIVDGDLTVEGDAALAYQISRWFYQPD